MPHSFDLEQDWINCDYPFEKENAGTSYISNCRSGNNYANTASAATIGDYYLFGGTANNSITAHKLTTESITSNTTKCPDLSEMINEDGSYKPGRYIGINGKAVPVDKINIGVENFTSELPGKDNNVGDLYYVRETQGIYCWNGTIWVQLIQDSNKRINIPISVVKQKSKTNEPKYNPDIINKYGHEVIDDVLFLDKLSDFKHISVIEVPPHIPSLSMLIVTYVILIGYGMTLTGYLNLIARVLIGLYVGITLKMRERKLSYKYVVTLEDYRYFDNSVKSKIRHRFKVVGPLSKDEYLLEPIKYKYTYPF